nr:cell wall integrity and stress response component 2-like [Aedes albopictus]
MQFEFTEVFNSFINNDSPPTAAENNKRDRTSSSTSSFPRIDKRMRVDVSVDVDDFNVPLSNSPKAVSSKQIVNGHPQNSATASQLTAVATTAVSNSVSTVAAAAAAAVSCTTISNQDTAAPPATIATSQVLNQAIHHPASTTTTRTTDSTADYATFAAAAAANRPTVANQAFHAPLATATNSQVPNQAMPRPASATNIQASSIENSTSHAEIQTPPVATLNAATQPHQANFSSMNIPSVNMNVLDRATPLPQRVNLAQSTASSCTITSVSNGLPQSSMRRPPATVPSFINVQYPTQSIFTQSNQENIVSLSSVGT